MASIHYVSVHEPAAIVWVGLTLPNANQCDYGPEYQHRKMRINKTGLRPMKEPRSGIIGREPDGDVIASRPDVDDIPPNRVHVVVHRTSRATNNVEGVLVYLSFRNRARNTVTDPVQMERMLE